ncbi:CDP-alcohol phosphatidyltransferase family protein [Sphingomonas sp.]|uniref:CDP-alcohol phosphatidyltransferase family protein n=1 Tax=Sphingomonas sp. TaxID=28214 RepID=UPI002C2EE53E|nr:CDP-alcohol phosphatidyltransferase family protein [Sphingomonas sp.]HTG38418.1 CDP-alcohol phosphatidyltransferase family protein [Sphingomonas sp.]
MPQILVLFSGAATAEYRVAGIPAAARAAHALAALEHSGDIDGCAIIAGPDWTPGAEVIAECARLAPRLPTRFSDSDPGDDVVVVRGERFVAAVARQPGEPRRDGVLPVLFDALSRPDAAPVGGAAGMRALRRASRDILSMTGKAGDGIVSRYVNRPISRAISGLLLKVPGLTPFHASIGTAVLGIAMTLALILGNGPGLIAGAILFQAASIFDGVDGEMARATCRTSREGATLDSVIDACTNLAFVTGVTANVGLAGDLSGALAGGIALLALASGLLLIGTTVTAAGEPVNFDIVKKHFRRNGRPNRITEWLIHLTMRDFFAAASAVMILAGLTHSLLILFAAAAVGWFAVTLGVLRHATRSGPAKPRVVRGIKMPVAQHAGASVQDRRHPRG